VFASPHTRGLRPFWPDITLAKVIRPRQWKPAFKNESDGTRFATRSQRCSWAMGKDDQFDVDLPIRHTSRLFHDSTRRCGSFRLI
jgi:hypothetical protein